MCQGNTRIIVHVKERTTTIQVDQATDSQPTNAVELVRKANVPSFINSVLIFILRVLHEYLVNPFRNP